MLRPRSLAKWTTWKRWASMERQGEERGYKVCIRLIVVLLVLRVTLLSVVHVWRKARRSWRWL